MKGAIAINKDKKSITLSLEVVVAVLAFYMFSGAAYIAHTYCGWFQTAKRGKKSRAQVEKEDDHKNPKKRR
jgi:hypothetical protein